MGAVAEPAQRALLARDAPNTPAQGLSRPWIASAAIIAASVP